MNLRSLFVVLAFDSFCMFTFSALGAIFSATDSVCTLQVLSQDETPFLYSLVFGEGVVNDATSVVLFNAIQNFDLGDLSTLKFFQFIGNFLYLFGASTFLGVAVSSSPFSFINISSSLLLLNLCHDCRLDFSVLM
jgi:NhaP-type Na+/H+ or K+/H+ antiporter